MSKYRIMIRTNPPGWIVPGLYLVKKTTRCEPVYVASMSGKANDAPVTNISSQYDPTGFEIYRFASKRSNGPALRVQRLSLVWLRKVSQDGPPG